MFTFAMIVLAGVGWYRAYMWKQRWCRNESYINKRLHP